MVYDQELVTFENLSDWEDSVDDPHEFPNRPIFDVKDQLL